jgi:hypothetical protein
MHKHKVSKKATSSSTSADIASRRLYRHCGAYRTHSLTFVDAYFNGRYAQGVCSDGSIFVDRDGERFGHVLEYMRDGFMSVAEAGARPSVSLLRVLKREFGFYCIEPCAKRPKETEIIFVSGGERNEPLSSVELMVEGGNVVFSCDVRMHRKTCSCMHMLIEARAAHGGEEACTTSDVVALI